MLKNYILVALRNIKKHKFFAAINIIGLSLSMSVCLVLILLVHDHFKYDKFHPNGDRTFRVVTYTSEQEGPFDEVRATSPVLLKDHLINDYAFVESATNLNHQFRGEIRSPHKILEISSLFADDNFFDVFGFEVEEGSTSGLDEPFSLMLSSSLANKLFPNQSSIGQTVEFEDHGSYKVIAVVKDPPGKSHIKFEALASFPTIPLLVDKGVFDEGYDDWENTWANYNYLVLQDPQSRSEAEQAINEIFNSNVKLEEDHPGYVLRLQAMNEIVPGGIMSNEISFTLPWFVLVLFAVLGLIVMITATINYTNLSIARSLSRTKEIGIRKVNGARRKQIIVQFLVESVLISMISLITSVFIYRVLIHYFNEIWIFNQVGISIQDSWSTYIYFFLFTLVLGLLTGIGPSLFLSKMDIIKSLKGSMNVANKRKSIIGYLTGKRTLMSIQFTLSMIMLVTILVLKNQANFLVQADFGFDDDKVFYVENQGHDPNLIKKEFGAISGVEAVSFTSHHPAVGRSWGTKANWKVDQEPISLYYFSVDPSYVQVMGLELKAGSNFASNVSTINEKAIVLNEKAIEIFGFESASQAIGEIITIDTLRLTVSGVVNDYHWEPLMKSIRPLALRIMPDDYSYSYFKLANVNGLDSKNSFEEKWSSFDEGRDFKGGYLDEKLDEFYQFFYDIGGILGYIALLAVVITSLGFLGMVSFEMKTKVKEIGIRKVLGASFKELTFTMSKGFLIMIVLTSIIAIPAGIWMNGLWVTSMASHAPVGFTAAVPALLIIGSISLTAILSQVWINSNKNPSETLRVD